MGKTYDERVAIGPQVANGKHYKIIHYITMNKEESTRFVLGGEPN